MLDRPHRTAEISRSKSRGGDFRRALAGVRVHFLPHEDGHLGWIECSPLRANDAEKTYVMMVEGELGVKLVARRGDDPAFQQKTVVGKVVTVCRQEV